MSNRDWWPNQLDLSILRQNSAKSDPLGAECIAELHAAVQDAHHERGAVMPLWCDLHARA